eukprot:SAG31_NODE_245_length_19224_cov_10.210614_8_plen_161_part_00
MDLARSTTAPMSSRHARPYQQHLPERPHEAHLSRSQLNRSPGVELFTVSQDDISFGNVVLNDVHRIRTVRITNVCDDPLSISLRCNLNERGGEQQVSFQLENLNLLMGAVSCANPATSTTGGGVGQQLSESFNQVFNTVRLSSLRMATSRYLDITWRSYD